MGRISNAMEIARASWSVLDRDRRLLAVPAVAGVAALLVFAAIFAPAWFLLGGSRAVDATDVALWLELFVAFVAATWVSAIGEAVLIAAAGARMDGGPADLDAAVHVARRRVPQLLGWAVLANVVSVVLNQVERLGILGHVVSWIGGVAFRLLSFLALPVIVFEDVGAVEAFRRSSRLLKRTWGEQLSFNFGVGVLVLLALLPAVVVGGGLLATGWLPLQVVGAVAGAAWIVAVLSVEAALSAVFKAALYRFAMGLPVDAAFGPAQLSGAFRSRDGG